jgi:hypothetical protein
MKKMVVGIVMIIMFSAISTACDNSTPPNSSSPTTQTPVTTQPVATEPDYPVSARLDILPITDKEMEVHFTINIDRIWDGIWQYVEATSGTLVNSRAWITVLWAGIDGPYSEARQYTEIPFEDIVVSGGTVWEGNALETRTIELRSTIRLPKEGKWEFIGQFAGEGWQKPVIQYQHMAVADGMAIPYYSQDIKDSPLAYLKYFGYGTTGKLPADEYNPVSLELDMTHPPLAGEEVTVTYLALSPYYNIDDFEVRTYFTKRVEDNKIVDVPAADIVVSTEIGWDVDAHGNTIWKDWETDIAKDGFKELTHIIKFPEPGEWEIYIHGRCVIEGMGVFQTGDGIKINITEDDAYYGWQDRRSSKTTISQETTASTITSQEQTTPAITEPAIDHTANTLWWWIGGGVLVAGILVFYLLFLKKTRR